MSYTVTDQRLIPANSAAVNYRTGKVVTTPNAHAGEHAVHVRLADGRGAWGFGACCVEAETAAVAAASAI